MLEFPDPQLFGTTVLRWLEITGVVLFVGATSFRQLTFLSSTQAIIDPVIRKRILDAQDRHLKPRLALNLSFLFTLQWISLINQLFLNSTQGIIVSVSSLISLFNEPNFVVIWSIKLLLLVFLFIVSRSHIKQKWPLLLAVGTLLCLMQSLSGHAVSQEAYYLVLTDWLHFVAVSVWAGGLLPLRGIARRSQHWLESTDLAAFLSRIVEVFSIWAIFCVITIITTGTFNAMIYLGPKGIIIEPQYGKVLLIKLSFVFVGFSIGGFTRFYILPRLQKSAESASAGVVALERLFHRAITIEIAVVCIVLMFAALLTQAPPPLGG